MMWQFAPVISHSATLNKKGAIQMVSDGPTRNRDVPVLLQTLVASGFLLDKVSTADDYMVLDCHRFDEFAVSVPYKIVLATGRLSTPSASVLKSTAKREGAHLLAIAESAEGIPCLSLDKFLARCGGPIRSWIPFDVNFEEKLVELGHNRPVEDYDGKPDTLFEEFVQLALQFILNDRVVQYGQERSFESVPDGIAFSNRTPFLYDAKAYRHGYEIDSDSIRQFGDYITSFHDRYQSHLPRVHSFVIISGSFKSGLKARQNKSRDLHADTGVVLSCFTAAELGATVKMLRAQPSLRNLINWKRVFSNLDVSSGLIEKEMEDIRRDSIVGGR